jgi:uncharacterized membrane protein YfcA
MGIMCALFLFVSAAFAGALNAVVGGYLGTSLARRLDPVRVRRFVLAFAWAMTLYFFVRG